MIQPARVLPSNASPLRDDNNVYQASRILQEHSGNRQHSRFLLGDEYESKPQPSAFFQNNQQITLPQTSHQTRAPQLYHPQPQHRQVWRYGHVRGALGVLTPEAEAVIRFDSERLFNRFRKSEQYVKYRNRQVKDDKGTGEQKWPEHLEKAFFRALVQWPPQGRRKYLWKDKLRGRNELIADCIEELTGEARTRKQVSSHIQVLKPFVDSDPYIMKWLAKTDMGYVGRYHGSANYTNGRRMSNYPVNAPPSSAHAGMRTLPRPDPVALKKAKAHLDVFEPVDFQMFVQRNYKVSKDHEEVQRLHTYTQSIASPLDQDTHRDGSFDLDRDFPLLAAMHATRPLDCNVLDAEASLAFPTETWKGENGSPMPGVELGIYFLCTSRHLPPTPVVPTPRDRAYQIRVHNTFYENGVCVKDHSGPSEARLEPSERGGSVETRIKFGSTFWARTLGRLAGRLLDPNRDHREEVSTYLRSINAVQEIMVLLEGGLERLLVIHWKFRLSSSAKGRASWKRITLPNSSSQFTAVPKTERSDSMYDYTYVPESSVSQQQQVPSHLTLQSPFEYESSTGSTLSSATWPATLSDVGVMSNENGSAFAIDNLYDFNAGTINFTYDPSLNFDQFDSSAFNFDTAAVDFAADPALQEYSQQWYDSYANTFGEQQIVAGGDSFTAPPELHTHVPAFSDFSTHYDQQGYVGTHESQAYGGAGQDMLKDEVALAALADASFIASKQSLDQPSL